MFYLIILLLVLILLLFIIFNKKKEKKRENYINKTDQLIYVQKVKKLFNSLENYHKNLGKYLKNSKIA